MNTFLHLLQSVTDEPITGRQWKSRVHGDLEEGLEQTVPINTSTTIVGTESPMDVGVPVFTDSVSGGTNLYLVSLFLMYSKFIFIRIILFLNMLCFN